MLELVQIGDIPALFYFLFVKTGPKTRAWALLITYVYVRYSAFPSGILESQRGKQNLKKH